MPSLSYFEVTGTWEPSATQGAINGSVTFTMLVENNGVLAAPTLDNPAIVVPTVIHTTISNGVLVPVSLLANTPALNVDGDLFYTASFSNVYYSKRGEKTAGLALPAITFAAPTDSTPIDLVDVVPAAGLPAIQNPLPSVIAANILDATTLGRQLLMAPDAATARTDIGAAGVPAAGVVKSTGSALATAVSGTDYAPATTGSGLLKGNGSGGFSSATSGTDYAPPTSGSALLKGNGSGGFTAAVANTDYAGPANAVAITGGTLDGVTIGGTTAASVNANTLTSPASRAYSGTTGLWLNQSQTITGTASSTTASANYLNFADQVNYTGTSSFTGLLLIDFVTSPAVGGRVGIWGQTVVNSVGTLTANTDYVGVAGLASTGASLGGVSGTPIGSFWGGWFVCGTTGGNYHTSVMGVEVDVHSMSSWIRQKIGVRIVLGTGDVAQDTVRGALDDVALQVVQNSGAMSWAHGIKFGTDQWPDPALTSGAWPFNSTSTMFGTSAVGNGLPANIGHDYRNITFSTAAFLAGAAPIGLSTMASAPSAMTGIGLSYVASDGSFHYLSPGSADTQLGPNLVPATNNTYNLGSGSKYWASAYIANLNVISTFPAAASTATAAGTTTLNVSSYQVQVFTGSTTQTVLLPTASVPVGMTYLIINQSSGAVTVQSSGGNTIAVLAGNTQGQFIAQKASPTAQNDWAGHVFGRGKALTVDNSLELAGTDGTKMTFPGSSDTVATLAAAQALTHKDLTDATNTFPTLNQSTTGNAATATKLATARNINGVPFDGSAAVEVNEGFAPSDYSYKWWSYDPVKASGTTNSLTAGQTYGTLIVVRASTTINNVVLVIGTAGSGLTSGQNFAGLFDSSGNLLSATADQSTNWQSSGKKVMALTTPQSVSPGLYYVGWFANGTTPPKFNYDNSTNAGCAAAGSIASSPRSILDTTNTGLTTAFHSPVALTTASPIYWAGVS